MNPSATLRLRRWTAFACMAWACMALFHNVVAHYVRAPAPEWPLEIAGVGGVFIVQGASPEGAHAGIKPGDRLVAFDGQPIGWRSGGRRALTEGQTNLYTIEKPGGRMLEVALEPQPPGSIGPVSAILQLAILAVGIVYLTIGVAVWRSRPGRVEAWALLLFCATMATSLFTAVRADNISFAYPRMILNSPLLGATAFHLFTTYPFEPHWIVRHRRIRTVPYGIAAIIGVLFFAQQPLGLPAQLAPALSFLFGLGFAAAGLGNLVVERRREHDPDVTARADVMLIGALVSFVPVLLILTAQFFLRSSFPYYYAMLWLFVFPLAVAYGILRRDLFDIRGAAKSSVAYGLASVAITGVYAVLIAFSDALIVSFDVNARAPAFQVGFLFFAILLFNPIRNSLQRLVDRTFDRDRATYRQAVREISEAMVSMLSLREIGDRILIALTDTMGVERAMVLLLDDDERVLRPTAWRGDWDAESLEVEIPASHPIWKHLWMRREELTRRDFDDEPDPEARESCRDIFDTLEMEILVPILFGVDLLGVIAVGRKITGDGLGVDDRQLLRTLANQSAIAIENAQAYDEIAKLNETLEARVEERTGELRETQQQLVQAEKMKSLGQLVAGVAHELNNPIGFVHANLQLMNDYVAKLLAAEKGSPEAEKAQAAIAKLLSRSQEGTNRVKQIVLDLKTFSRMDQTAVQDVDLHEEIDRTLTLMEPRLKDTITVERNYGRLPHIRCNAGQLNQVFMNLLMNACDALEEEGGTIRIVSQPRPDGVRLEFEDDGPGMPPDIQGRIFDPFFTTKDPGKGTGLGLSMSHQIIERHGGRMVVSSEPGTGSRFIIDLPIDATPTEE
ncbi:MAG: GAF domain-containing protein [Deltaproteobacteria bacterium]|nr:GAF domain-containing protein [Deltaproteobacteria bacterium]MBW2447171.1 GAF domain-containing protein [Deltaproteobacteria bacterium]